MSFKKSDLLALGITWVIRKYVAKRVSAAVLDVVDAASSGLPVPDHVTKAIEVARRAQFEATMLELQVATAKAAKSMAESFEKNDRNLAKQAEALRFPKVPK